MKGARRAFTLVEVLIAVAIALLLIVGISQIFAIAQRTTSMGTALLSATAADRSLQNTLNRDFHAIVPISDPQFPGFVIASYSAAMFRNKADYDSSTNQPDPTDFGPNFTNPTAPYSQAFSTNFRIHRLDRLCFFARDFFHRQSADAPSLSSSTTSNEGFIWYGHLALPNNPAITNWDSKNPGDATAPGASWFNPGVPAITTPINDNNQYASQMILGRQVMLLAQPTGPTPAESGFILSNTPGAPYPLALDPNNGAKAFISQTDQSASGPFSVPLYCSRYDLCYSTIANWNLLISNSSNFPTTTWWEQLSGLRFKGATSGDIEADQRYYANPYPTKQDPATIPLPVGWNSAAAALTSPIFVRGCSQFIVEFAGDFTTQDPVTGEVVAGSETAQDGQIDFIIDPVTKQRRIRWYGLPRDTGSTNGANQPDGNFDNADVMPVGMFTHRRRIFEKELPDDVNPGQYLWPFPKNGTTGGGDSAHNFPMHSKAYVCTWSPDNPLMLAYKPKMIRITIAIDDANGRLNSEQTYEYIFTLP
jgi:prepilin-type N-terminal cleavage/methylation domain-containing protein